jgi:glycine/D-amino acid oxidase-like deaminating enzyme
LARRSYELHKEHGKIFGDSLYRSMDTWSVSVHPKGDPKDLASENLKWLDSCSVSGLSHLSNEDSSAQVHPLRYTESIFAECLHRGAQFVQGEALNFESFNSSDGAKQGSVRLKMLSTDGKMITFIDGDIFVVCLGCWSDVLLQDWLAKEVLSAICASSIVLKPHGEVPNVALFTNWYTPGELNSFDPEVYPRSDGTVYICARAESVPIPVGGTSTVIPNEEYTSKIEEFAAQLSPLLKNAPVLIRQACLLPTTIDDIPLIGSLSPESNIYVATGHSCWGILNAPATGEAIAQLIHEGKSDLNLDAFDPKRFI